MHFQPRGFVMPGHEASQSLSNWERFEIPRQAAQGSEWQISANAFSSLLSASLPTTKMSMFICWRRQQQGHPLRDLSCRRRRHLRDFSDRERPLLVYSIQNNPFTCFQHGLSYSFPTSEICYAGARGISEISLNRDNSNSSMNWHRKPFTRADLHLLLCPGA